MRWWQAGACQLIDVHASTLCGCDSASGREEGRRAAQGSILCLTGCRPGRKGELLRLASLLQGGRAVGPAAAGGPPRRTARLRPAGAAVAGGALAAPAAAAASRLRWGCLWVYVSSRPACCICTRWAVDLATMPLSLYTGVEFEKERQSPLCVHHLMQAPRTQTWWPRCSGSPPSPPSTGTRPNTLSFKQKPYRSCWLVSSWPPEMLPKSHLDIADQLKTVAPSAAGWRCAAPAARSHCCGTSPRS